MKLKSEKSYGVQMRAKRAMQYQLQRQVRHEPATSADANPPTEVPPTAAALLLALLATSSERFENAHISSDDKAAADAWTGEAETMSKSSAQGDARRVVEAAINDEADASTETAAERVAV